MSANPVTRRLRIVARFAPVLFLGCWTTEAVRVSGDATETGNATLAGLIVDGNGKGVRQAEVFALPANFDPMWNVQPDSLRTQTDSGGHYAYAKLAPGRYNVFARHVSGLVSLHSGIEVSSTPTQVKPDTLKSPGKVWVPLPENAVADGYIYVPGTLIHTSITAQNLSAGGLRLDAVPAGTLPEIDYRSADSDTTVFRIDSGVVVSPNTQTNVPAIHQWKDSLTLRLNTSGQDSGLNLKDTLFDFPLAVRLQPPDFDFHHALPQGQDLRFYKSHGGKIPFEIESWDSLQGALIWVRIDTLLPRNAQQTMVAYYGNKSALATIPSPVFDTSRGYSAVWHLSEEIPDTVANGSYKDAGNAGNNADDRLASAGREGVLGNGHSFAGSDYLEIPNAKTILKPKNFTLSAWVKSSQTEDYNGEILSMGDNYGLRLLKDGNAYVFYLPPLPADSTVNSTSFLFVSAGAPILNDGSWHWVSATLTTDSLQLFLDGAEIGSKKASGTVNYSNQLGNNFLLGRHGNGKSGFQLHASLDEVEVQNQARSKEWIRATYENQRPGSKFPKPK